MLYLVHSASFLQWVNRFTSHLNHTDIHTLNAFMSRYFAIAIIDLVLYQEFFLYFFLAERNRASLKYVAGVEDSDYINAVLVNVSTSF